MNAWPCQKKRQRLVYQLSDPRIQHKKRMNKNSKLSDLRITSRGACTSDHLDQMGSSHFIASDERDDFIALSFVISLTIHLCPIARIQSVIVSPKFVLLNPEIRPILGAL
jgi:hypothetical protein